MKFKLWVLICLISFLWIGPTLSAIKEEKAEERLEARGLAKTEPDYKLFSTAEIFFGYDSNPNLTPEGKGDMFEQFIYSLDFTKPFSKTLKFTFDYDLDVINYNEITDVSNILNHFRLGLHKKFSFCTVGGGYDLGILYYPKDESENFLFHKAFIYAKKNFSRRLYHKLQLEYGFKHFTDKKALGQFYFPRQDNNQQDERFAAAYDIGYRATPKLTIRFKNKFYLNDSNAIFLDFHDYIAHRHALSMDYKVLQRLYLLGKFDYRRKEYKERRVVLGTSKQKDNLYTATAGVMYKLTDKDSVSLYYIYRNNDSNEPLEEYTENVVTCGWQHNF